MNQSGDFWDETKELLYKRVAQCLQLAQGRGNSLLNQFKGTVEPFLEYNPLIVPRQSKQRSRVWEKAWQFVESVKNPTPDDVVERIRDLAGGRILVIGIDDIKLVYQNFRLFIEDKDHHSLYGEPRIHLKCANEGGFRGLIQDTNIVVPSGDSLPFEVQILTLMQHCWAELEHRIYEQTRSSNDGVVPDSVTTGFRLLSDKMYKLDCMIETLRATTTGKQNK